MKICKRIITSFVVLVTCFSLCTTSVLAAWQNELGYWYVNSNFAQWAVGGILSYAGSALGGMAGTIVLPGGGTIEGTALGATAGAAASAGIYDLASYYAAGYTDDDYYTAESDYISTLDSAYGTSTFDSYGILLPSLLWSKSSSSVDVLNHTGAVFEANYTSSLSFRELRWYFDIPSSGNYVIHMPVGSCSCGSSHAYSGSDYYFGLNLVGSGRMFYDWYSSDYSYSIGMVGGEQYYVEFWGGPVSTKLIGYHKFSFEYCPYMVRSDYIAPPESTTRSSSLMQTINNYNSVDNSVNYYIGTLNVDGAVEDTYDPALYDEETLVFTEPVTGAQYQTSGWVYDYNTRSYDLDLESGTFLIGENDITRILLTYGDDGVTIDYYAGDALVTTDTYAYVIAEQVDQSTCAHEYSAEITDPTCSDYGKAVYTCTRCGHTYTETIPALGHDWLATEVTATTYALPDGTSCPSCAGTAFTHTRNGDIYTCTCSDCGTEWSVNAVITYGSTTYTCSRCGESYVEQDGKGLSEGLGDAIKSFAKKAWSAIASGIGKLFSGFADLLGGFFGFLSYTLLGGVKAFFASFSDDSVIGFFRQKNSDGSTSAALPEGVASTMTAVSGLFTGLPAELRGVLGFGIAMLFLIAAFKLVL